MWRLTFTASFGSVYRCLGWISRKSIRKRLSLGKRHGNLSLLGTAGAGVLFSSKLFAQRAIIKLLLEERWTDLVPHSRYAKIKSLRTTIHLSY